MKPKWTDYVTSVCAGFLIVYISWMVYDTKQLYAASGAPYNMSLICTNEFKASIVAAHVRITMRNHLYILERNDGHFITYDKDGQSYCVSLLDADVIVPTNGTRP